ncbi:hypothetical protein LTS17_010375 [Exophiala oligosperma]
MAKLLQYLLLSDIDLATSIGLFLTLCAVYLLIRTLYRLFFHPLQHIPGPKLAAASHIVEFYYDVIKGGQFIFEIERWHRKYGPIVRINPRQIHISDPDYYDEIYAPSSKKRDKDPIFTAQFGAPESIIATVKHEHHRMRRSVMNSFFSKRSVMQLEPLIQEKIDLLAERFIEAKQSGMVLKLEYAYAALTADVISHYCYGKSEGYLDHHWPQNDIKDGLSGMGHFTHYFYFFPILASLTQKLPTRLLEKLDPAAKCFVDLQGRFIEASKRAIRKGPRVDERPSLFDALIDPSLPESERSVGRLSQEAMIVLGAGTETTANTLSIGSYHLIRNRPILLKLREEVKQVLPNLSSRATWVQLEQLPYLTAVINESLRIAIGSTMRSARVANEPISYKDYVIPAGVSILAEFQAQVSCD